MPMEPNWRRRGWRCRRASTLLPSAPMRWLIEPSLTPLIRRLLALQVADKGWNNDGSITIAPSGVWRGIGESRGHRFQEPRQTRHCRHLSKLCRRLRGLEVEGAANRRQCSHAVFHRPYASLDGSGCGANVSAVKGLVRRIWRCELRNRCTGVFAKVDEV